MLHPRRRVVAPAACIWSAADAVAGRRGAGRGGGGVACHTPCRSHPRLPDCRPGRPAATSTETRRRPGGGIKKFISFLARCARRASARRPDSPRFYSCFMHFLTGGRRPQGAPRAPPGRPAGRAALRSQCRLMTRSLFERCPAHLMRRARGL